MSKQKHTITRSAALIEINGEVLIMKLSPSAWAKVMDIAAMDNGGTLVVDRVPNQRVLDELMAHL